MSALSPLLFLYVYKTRTSPPGAVGAVGHPFGQSRLVDRNARCSQHPLRGCTAPSGPPSTSLLLPGCLPPPAKIGVRSLGRTTFSSRNRSMTNPKKYFPSSPTGCHDVSAVKSIHYGGEGTSNLPLNSLANLYIRYRRDFLHHMLL